MNNGYPLSFTTIALISLIAVIFFLPDFAWADEILSWGLDDVGQVTNTPADSNFTAIAAGYKYSLALRADGSIASWGYDYYGQVSDTPIDNNFVAIAAGGYHGLALGADGSITSWGSDSHGQVSNTPAESNFVAIAAGDSHSLAMRDDGSLISWGHNSYSQVSDTPVGNNFTAIAAKGYNSLALRTDGSIVSWGEDLYHQVSDTPASSNFTAIAVGSHHCLALKTDGSIISWGDPDSGGVISNTPPESNFIAICGGGECSFALRADGSIASWGSDWSGQVSGIPAGNNFTAITAGNSHSLALIPTPLLLKPNGNERLNEGGHYEIKWSGDVSGNELLIEYSINNGADWNTITNVQDSNSYDWQVPGPASKDCLVRVSYANLPSVNDTSDNTFLIYSCSEELTGDLNHDCQVDMRDFAVVAQNWLSQSRCIIYSFPLNSVKNWTTEGQWEFGQPTGSGGISLGYPDPYSGYTGVNVYGVNLDGDYTVAIGGPYYLTAGPFDCSGFHDMKLRFARWLNTDSSSYVQNKIQASNDGATWQTVWESTTEVTDSSWQIVEYDVSEIADNQLTVYFRWSYEIVAVRAYLCSGWNIDDIELSGMQ